MLKKITDFIENFIEAILFGSRWLLAPFYIGLVGALVILLVKFVKKFIYIVPTIADASSTELILSILGLIDIVLIANLLLMIILSGYENFVSKIDAIKDHVDRPEWMGKVDYAGLKLKVISSIVAISSIELLKVFIHISEEGDRSLFTGNSLWEIEVFWLILLHLTFVFSGLIFAYTEKTMHPPHNDGH